MWIVWYILMLIVIGVVSGVITGAYAVSSLFVPSMASKPDLSKVKENLDDSDDPDRKRILIAYNTKNGGSVTAGLKIQEVLQKAGFAADLRYIPYMMDSDADISQYDAFIVGGAIYWSRFMKETWEFLTKHLETFKQKPTALYMLSGRMCNDHATKLQGDEAKWLRLSLAYLEPMFETMPGLKPALVDIGSFPGNIKYKMMNLSELIMMGLHMRRTGLPQGDYLRLERVAAWTEELVDKLNFA